MKMKQIVCLLSAVLIALLAGCATTDSGAEETGVPAETVSAEPKTEIVQVPMLQKETSFIEEDILESYQLYRYEGELLSAIELYDSFDELIEVTRLEYAGGSEPVRRTVLDPKENLRSMRVYAYDDAGRKVSEEVYNRNEVLQTTSQYIYDEDGNLVRWNVADGGGTVMAYTEYIYQNGRNTRTNTYSADGTLRDYFVHTWENGVRIRTEEFDKDGDSAGQVEYRYSGDLLTEEIHRRANGSLERTIAYEYDENGSVIREIYMRADGTVEQVIAREITYRQEERTVEE